MSQDEIYNVSKVSSKIGHELEITMEQGIRNVIRWYREKGLV